MADANASTGQEFLYKLEITRWAEFTVWLLFFAIGVPGNLLILTVYLKKKVRTTTHVFIGALALADLSTCVMKLVDAIAIASVSRYLKYDRTSAIYFLSTGLLYTTAFLTMSIAYDRFDAVCRSLERTMTLTRARVIAGFCYAAGFIGTIPEASVKIGGINYHNTENFFFIEAVVKFIPLTLYIVSLIAVAAFYCIIFVFMRKRGKGLAPSSTVGGAKGQQGDLASTASCGASERPAQRDTLDGSSSVQIIPGACTPKTLRPASQTPERSDALVCSSQSQQPAAVSNARLDQSKSQQASAVNTTRIYPPAISMPSITESENPSVVPNRRSDGPSGASHQQADGSNAKSQQAAAQSRLTKMLCISTFMFFFLWLPYMYLRFYSLGSLFSDFTKSSSHANVVAALIFLRDIVFFNSVINAFIYGMANRRFRSECKIVLHNMRQRFC